MLIFPQIPPMIVRLAPVFPRNNALSKAQLALSSSKRFIVRADEKLTPSVEVALAIRAVSP
jgi:hypothetical protein